jgi:hypothetical protein
MRSEGLRSMLAVGLAGLSLAGCSPNTDPSTAGAMFVVDVAGERFVLSLSDPETVSLARANLAGRNHRFPIGPLRSGDGGFNQPWSWHLDPAETRMTEAAIEVCDGRPSYVEAHRGDFATYCPWGARIISERR